MIYPSSYHYECTYFELKKLSTFKDNRKKLTYRQNKILQFVGANRSVSPFDLSKEYPYSNKPIEYGNAKKDLRNLKDLNFLERDHERTDKSKYYYKLSKNGVYFLIVNNENLHFEIIRNLLSNYSDHLLLGFFLFPYLEVKTLKKLADPPIFTQIFSYLHDCCKQLEDMDFNIKHTTNQENGYLTSQLCIWENIPQTEYDRENLRNFLRQKFNWKWLHNAKIKKTEDGNGIIISYGANSILISLNKKVKTATVSFRGRKYYQFIVRSVGDAFAIDVLTTKRVEEQFMTFFLIAHVVNIPKYIISLIPLHGSYSITPDMEVLGQDKRFTQILRKTKYRFDKTYKLIIEN